MRGNALLHKPDLMAQSWEISQVYNVPVTGGEILYWVVLVVGLIVALGFAAVGVFIILGRQWGSQADMISFGTFWIFASLGLGAAFQWLLWHIRNQRQ